jgi:hypothetical protein
MIFPDQSFHGQEIIVKVIKRFDMFFFVKKEFD